MSTTDKLHRELDKRGIRWFVTPRGSTSFTSPVLGRVFVWENSDGGFALDAGYAPMTLEQVIAATVGCGTCHDLGGTGANGEQVFHCSECGCVMSLYDLDGANILCTNHVYDYPRYCPNCGARIEAGDE